MNISNECWHLLNVFQSPDAMKAEIRSQQDRGDELGWFSLRLSEVVVMLNGASTTSNGSDPQPHVRLVTDKSARGLNPHSRLT